MLIFVVRRLGTMVLTMVVVSILLFLVLEINIEGVAVKVIGNGVEIRGKGGVGVFELVAL